MKQLSVKVRMAVWLTALMALLWGVLLVFMLSISTRVARNTAQAQLVTSVRAALPQVALREGKLLLTDGFPFYENGVSLLVYSKGQSLLAGQVPVSLPGIEGFENGTVRTASGGVYLVLDVWVPSGWEDGVWLRGLMEVPAARASTQNLLRTALIALPLFILMAALGSYTIARQAFRPLDSITATAASITEARDLSRRIGLPPGRDEFSRLAAAFDGLFARLEESFEAEKQFTADASHELRTPVSVIKGACECAIRYDETEEERLETLGIIGRQADRMSQLIGQLLAMTRLEQGTEAMRMEELNVTELVEDHCREQEYEGLVLELPGPIFVRGDGILLVRLLQNLIENACKYGKKGGLIRVSLSKDGEEVTLSVQDEGPGIPPEYQEKIWQRFYQIDTSRNDEGGGAGLGLSMVRQIARLHGGDAMVASTMGQGSTFTVRLPAGKKKEEFS